MFDDASNQLQKFTFMSISLSITNLKLYVRQFQRIFQLMLIFVYNDTLKY